MKFFIFFLVFGLIQASAETRAQNVTISGNEIPLKKVFKDIERQANYVFFYDADLLKIAKPVTIHVKNTTVEKALDLVFANQPLTWTLVDKTVTVVRKPAQPSLSEMFVDMEVPYIQITGKVTNEQGHPLSGVSILVKGTKLGTQTNSNGEFSIKNVDEDATLVFSSVGYVTIEEKVKNRTQINITMRLELASLDEIEINTGYQTINQTRMTGSVGIITSKDIENKGYTSIDDILKGQLAGVATMSLSGRPGADAQIRIRGINSITGNSDPMWIVDGMPLQGDLPKISMGGTEFQETVLTSGIGNVSPDEIESITVLKDAAASAIYGARAANGVIVIKTKRGTAGRSFINFQTSFGFNEAPTNRLIMMNTKEKIAFERGIYEDFPGLNLGGRVFQLLKRSDNGFLTRKEAEDEIDKLSTINTDWFKEVFRTGLFQNHSISLSGGNERTQYYSSLFYNSEQGVMPNNLYNNIGASLKLTHDFNDRLRINMDLNTSLRNDRSSASVVNPLEYATYANPYERPFDDNGDYEFDRSYYPQRSTIKDGYMYDYNVLKDLDDNSANTRYINNRINIKLEYRIIKGLMISSMGTFSNSSNHTMSELIPESFSSKYVSWVKGIYAENEVPDYLNNGKMSESTARQQGWTVRNQLEFARGVGKDNYLSFYIGQEASSQKGYGFSSMIPEWNPIYGVATYPDLTGVPISTRLSFTELGSHLETQDRSASFFSIGSYSFKDKYIISGSGRLDGVDIIGTANRFSPLWNISGKWNLHNEKFLLTNPDIDMLALRFSYGFTGSIDRDILPFSRLTKVENFVYDGVKIMDRFFPASPPVKWQRKEDRNIGFDISVFKNRLNFTANYYWNDTRNLIDSETLPYSTGLTSIRANVASLRNSGWELTLRTMNIRTQNLTWTTSFNFTTNKNIVTKTFYEKLSDYTVNDNSTFESAYNRYVKGYSVKSYYAYRFAGVDPLTGGSLAYVNGVDDKGLPLGSLNEEGKYVYNMDYNLTAQLANASREFIGLSYPPITGGFSTQLNYKRLSFSTQFTFMTGHSIRSFLGYGGGTVANSAKNVLALEANRWRKPGDITDVPKYENGRTEYLYQLFDFRFEDGAYLKCNNISLGYNLSQELANKLNINRARINFNMMNVFTLTKYRGIDPENMGAFGYPSSKRYNFTFNIGI